MSLCQFALVIIDTLGTTAGDIDTNVGTATLIRFEPRLHDSQADTSSPWPASP